MNTQASVVALLNALPDEMGRSPEQEEMSKRSLAFNKYCVAPIFARQENHRNPFNVSESEFTDEIHVARLCSEINPLMELETKMDGYYARAVI